MDQSNASKSTGLEDQLRGMILDNVRTGEGQEVRQAQRGRGRGRGGSWRGGGNNNKNPPNRPAQGQVQQNNPSFSSAPPRRGARTDFDSQVVRQHQHQPRISPQTQQGPGRPPSGTTADVPGYHAVLPPRQLQSSRMQLSDHAKPHHQAPKILQRSRDNTHPPAQAQASQASAHQPRPQAPYQHRPHFNQPRENPMAQIEHLDSVAAQEIPTVEMGQVELEEKEAFRKQLESVLQRAFTKKYSQDIATISLVGFGSLTSGFAMPGSDMDLAIVPDWKSPSRVDQIGIDRNIPRLLERAVLDSKMGGRLLTRTRVPILKVCQHPTEALYIALSKERKKWDELPDHEKYPVDLPLEPSPLPKPVVDVNREEPVELTNNADSPGFNDVLPEINVQPKKVVARKASMKNTADKESTSPTSATKTEASSNDKHGTTNKDHHPRTAKPWAREKVIGPLDFPKQGVGIQCDINFDNPLGIHNTHLLRCYSLTDPRVRPIVLFVKAWAKRRKINSSYSGTLSSYGWVLMVLHYLVNIAQPPVCPNLQHDIPQPKGLGQLKNISNDSTIGGYTVHFWRNEQEIIQAAQAGELSQNRQTVGALLRGFFQYYASLSAYGSYGPRPPQFYWTSQVLSLRTPGGLLTKQDKDWVSAKTTVTAEKKVTNRYLFAIEDPFELDHNVARTVTHKGIVAIRDEFRRVWRILGAIGKGMQPEGGIFDKVIEDMAPPTPKEEARKMGMKDLGKSLESISRNQGHEEEASEEGKTILV